jgi:hypothetical protein
MIQIQQIPYDSYTQFKCHWNAFKGTLDVPFTEIDDIVLGNVVRAFKRKISDFLASDLKFEITKCEHALMERSEPDSKENLPV